MKDRIEAWAVWHPEHGFIHFQPEGAVAYADLCEALILDVQDQNEDDPKKQWKAVKVEIKRLD